MRILLFRSLPVLVATAVLMPYPAHAAKTFNEIVNDSIVPLGDLIVTLLYAVAFLFFLFGIMRYFFASTNEEARAKGKQHMMWGVIGLVVLFSVWGLVRILLNVLKDWSA
jgi:succinate dehydrogenase/fumarate reductase cytochrome b subunit